HEVRAVAVIASIGGWSAGDRRSLRTLPARNCALRGIKSKDPGFCFDARSLRETLSTSLESASIGHHVDAADFPDMALGVNAARGCVACPGAGPAADAIEIVGGRRPCAVGRGGGGRNA